MVKMLIAAIDSALTCWNPVMMCTYRSLSCDGVAPCSCIEGAVRTGFLRVGQPTILKDV
jgi:hypothetical protein